MQVKNSVIFESSSLFSFIVLCIVSSSKSDINYTFYVDEGKNLTLPCTNANGPVMWIRDGRKDGGVQEVLPNGSLHLTSLTTADAGLYTCSAMVYDLYGYVNDLEENQTKRVRSDNFTLLELSRAEVHVRTTPGPVASFTCRATTIIAVIIWEVWPNRTGGYPVRDYTADMRRVPDFGENETEWQLLDPHHISPNARQLEIFHLSPNTTYEFRIWGNNKLGAGTPTVITVLTSPKTEEKDLIRKIMIDAQNFDTRVWIIAVGIVMGSLVILSLGTCIVLYKECREPTEREEELDSVELVPNIILNPGFCDPDEADAQGSPSPPITTRTYHSYRRNTTHGHLSHHPHRFGSDDDDDEDEIEEPMTFSRKMSIFFTGNTIKRI